MRFPNLTKDEELIRSYYLSGNFAGFRHVVSELGRMAPALVIAALSLTHGEGIIYVAFNYLLLLYIWRLGSSRWSLATQSLIEKYESCLAEPERARSC
jgi:hypothetical protein